MPVRPDMDPVISEALECLPAGICVFEPSGPPRLYNSLSRRCFPHLYDAYELHGAQTFEDALRYSLRRLLPEASAEIVEGHVQRLSALADSGEPHDMTTVQGETVEVRYKKMSGGRRVAISMDVTEDRQRQKELDRARKDAIAASNAKSAFLANMSHEIRTPLNGILGMAQVLEMSALSKEQHEQVGVILDSSRNLMALLNDVLDLSKIEAGKFSIVPSDNDLAHTMRRIYRLWKPKAEEAGLEFNLSLDAELPPVLNFDSVRVRQCVSNLVSNAIKFTSKGRVEVFVSAKPLDGGDYIVRVRVTDTGLGMDEATMARLFRPFVQADESTSRQFGGTGLGLSIVRRLAEMMGGETSVTSEPDRGSEFTFSFRACEPSGGYRLASQSGDEDDDAQRSNLRSQHLRVLLVDDHPINRQVATLFLRPFNMRIVEASNGREAMTALHGEPFDVVLLDVHMPVMDGLATIAEIRNSDDEWSDIPVIALTADAMSGDRERYLNLGMTGYLSKPLAERDLISEISRVRALSKEELEHCRVRAKSAA
ncbi:MAG: ATP-binding protein [Hyphomonadaceae bacterium]